MPTYRVTRVVSVAQAETIEEAREKAQAVVDAEGGRVTITCDDGSAHEHVEATEPVAEGSEAEGSSKRAGRRR